VHKFIFRYLGFLLAAHLFAFAPTASAQANNGAIRGTISDPTGAVIPSATVKITTANGHPVTNTTSDQSGAYQARNLTPGTYIVIASAPGFTPATSAALTLAAGQSKQFDVKLQIQVEKEQVQVNSETMTVDTSPENNANAIILKGKDLDALSDDPDELQSELQALAGPAAGPNGGEIYIDGFTGGQIPPKSSIREIRINQNPFSAEFDRLGYGRIEIFTKPGTDKLHGEIESRGNDSVFNSQNPILNANLKPGEPRIQEPRYYSYNLNGSVGGPITKSSSSYFLSAFVRNNQNESIVDAINPANTAETLNEAITNPSSRIDISPRIDIKLGESNTLTIRDEFYRGVQTNAGLSALTLPGQAYNTHSLENTLQISDSLVLSKHLVDDIRFQYRRIRTQQVPQSALPSVTLQGAFTTGGNNSGTVEDHQDDYELQNYFGGSLGKHSLNFGTRLRAYRDANYTNSGANSSYIFDTTANYLAGKPQQYTTTIINKYVARAIVFDAALFYQDDWKLSPRFTFSYGVRWESQNRINDKNDWAPRLTLAYALGKRNGAQPPKTVLRAGYGWFYQRFTVPNSFGSTQGTPYVIRAIHNNFVPLGSPETPNQQGITLVDPNFFNPNQPVTDFTGVTSAAAPAGYSIDPHFHAANDMQGAVGIDRQLSKVMTANLTYLYSRGVHMYLTNNVSAAGTFPEENVLSSTYPATPIPAPVENNMQYQSGGVYRQNQIIASITARYSRFSIFSFYTYNNARGDTSGVTYTPSIASHPGLDYGRTSFDLHHRLVILGSIAAPWQLSFAPFLSVNSGTPYNITTGRDLTGNNQFNARPTFAASCSQPNAVSTPYGCLDPDPLTSPNGASEKIIPYNLGTGPSNVSLNLRISKVIGLGPLIKGGGGQSGGPRGGPRGGGLGGRGLSGNQAGPDRLNATTPHKYNLTFMVYGQNILNHENLGTPNGTLTSPFFGRSQSLAGGFFGPSTAGNRSIFLAATFSF
jgi:hypothetical protein